MSLGYLTLALMLLLCLFGSYSIWVYAITLKVRLSLLAGPAPPLHLADQVRDRIKKQRRLAYKQNNVGTTITTCCGLFLLVWYFFEVPQGYTNTVSYLFWWVAAMVVTRILLGTYAAEAGRLVRKSNQDLHVLELAGNLHAGDNADEDDNPDASSDTNLAEARMLSRRRVVKLKVNQETTEPPTPAELSALLPSLARALTQAPAKEGESVLVLWKKQHGEVTAWPAQVQAITDVGVVPEESLRAFTTMTSGIQPPHRLKVSDRQFLGAAIALFLEDPDGGAYLGWIATTESAHILLASIPWLSTLEKELLYQLINPGKPFPYKRQE